MFDGPRLGAVQHAVGTLRECQGADNKGNHQYGTDKENRIMQIHPQDLHIILADIIVGLIINTHLSSVIRLALGCAVDAATYSQSVRTMSGSLPRNMHSSKRTSSSKPE